MSVDGPLLIAYDGSEGARTALAYAGELISGGDVVVLSVWEPLLLQSSAIAMSGMFVDPAAVEQDYEAVESATRTLATDGAEQARQAGFTAKARWQPGAGPIADTVIDVAAEIDARLIVTGSRGLGGIRSLLLGSVSERIVRHARRPVLIVPPGES